MGNNKDSELNFGAEPYVQALKERILRHLRDGGENPAFVAGIFGEWGCGKTQWLMRLQKLFDAESSQKEIFIPVFFNAWRFEREEHLVIPMLKLAYQEYEKREKEFDNIKVNAKTIKQGLGTLKDCAIALACGLSGKLQILGFAEAEFDLDKALAKDKELHEERIEKGKSASEHFSSIYYDFHEHFRKLTHREVKEGETRVSLVFLIDDVDRCLPEKAIEVLEAIKLFLEIEGCAFVLGLDEDVVTRGILHRYREYSFHNLNGNGQANAEIDHPITGHEYLEKIIHLPIRVPSVAGRDARDFLLKNYPALFTRKELESVETTDATKPGSKQKPFEDKVHVVGEKTIIDEALLGVFLNCVPHVPRKLIRTAELFDMLLTVARKKGLKGIEPPLLLRMVILQLFAPDIYRFGRSQPRFFATMIRWKEKWPAVWEIEDELETAWEAATDIPKLGLIQIDQPLLKHIRKCRKNRGGFDPRKLVLDGDDAEKFPSLIVYYTFIEHEGGAELKSPGKATLSADPDLAAEKMLTADLPTGKLKDITSFLEQMFSTDPLLWKNAMEQNAEQLQGRFFDHNTFQAVMGRLHDNAQFLPTEQMLNWIELLYEHLTPQQLTAIYRESRLLGRLEDQEKEGK